MALDLLENLYLPCKTRNLTIVWKLKFHDGIHNIRPEDPASPPITLLLSFISDTSIRCSNGRMLLSHLRFGLRTFCHSLQASRLAVCTLCVRCT